MSDRIVEALNFNLDSGAEMFEIGCDSLGNVFVKIGMSNTLRMLPNDAKKLADILNKASNHASRECDVVDDYVDPYEIPSEFIT